MHPRNKLQPKNKHYGTNKVLNQEHSNSKIEVHSKNKRTNRNLCTQQITAFKGQCAPEEVAPPGQPKKTLAHNAASSKQDSVHLKHFLEGTDQNILLRMCNMFEGFFRPENTDKILCEDTVKLSESMLLVMPMLTRTIP